MSRQKAAPPAAVDTADEPKIAAALDSVRQDAAATALVVAERNGRVTTLARQLRYEGATDPGTLENSARDAIRRIGMGIFELGAYLLLLREACEHGSFLPALERLGLDTRAAQRYMQVTRRFAANASSATHLEAAGVTRLTELLPLDDEQLEELTELGQTGELKLDDVAGMSVKELRAKVRELTQDAKATQQVLDRKNARIDKLERDRVRFAKQPPDEQLKSMLDEANRVRLDALAAIGGQLRMAVVQIQEHCASHANDRAAQDVALAGMLGSLTKALADLREEAQLPDVSSAADQQLAAEVAEWGKQS